MILIIDYGSGNLRSVAKAFESVTDKPVRVSALAKDLSGASHIVLPGVGAFADCMAGLKALPGMLDALTAQVMEKSTWFLGICVGMQMMFETGREHGTHAGLGWLKGEVVKLAPSDASLKIPHMGWNDLHIEKPSPLLSNIKSGDHAYFVHSYHAKAKAEDVLATTEYGGKVTAIVGQKNKFGTQFHPEKSQRAGLQLLKNFVTL